MSTRRAGKKQRRARTRARKRLLREEAYDRLLVLEVLAKFFPDEHGTSPLAEYSTPRDPSGLTIPQAIALERRAAREGWGRKDNGQTSSMQERAIGTGSSLESADHFDGSGI